MKALWKVSANLSGAKGLISQAKWLNENAETCDDGYIVYKSFGTNFQPPEHWKLEAGAELTEVVNSCRVSDCACGINVAIREWFGKNHGAKISRCLIPWEYAAGIVVPYHTNGKFRTEYVQLIDVVD